MEINQRLGEYIPSYVPKPRSNSDHMGERPELKQLHVNTPDIVCTHSQSSKISNSQATFTFIWAYICILSLTPSVLRLAS